MFTALLSLLLFLQQTVYLKVYISATLVILFIFVSPLRLRMFVNLNANIKYFYFGFLVKLFKCGSVIDRMFFYSKHSVLLGIQTLKYEIFLNP